MGKSASRHQAFVHPDACIDEGVTIGPFCYVGPDVTIGRGTVLMNNVSIYGPTALGEDNRIYPGAMVGGDPQDLSFRGEVTRLEIGRGNTIRECVTISRGTKKGGSLTRIGDNNLIMACCHIAHDCVLENNVVMANGTLLGGHVLVESSAIFGGMAAVHHFATVGRMSFIGGLTRISKDVPPFMTVEGNPSRVWCVNVVGCKRNGLGDEAIAALKEAHRLIFRTEGPWEDVFQELEAKGPQTDEVQHLIRFLRQIEKGKQGRAREALRAAFPSNQAAGEDE